MPEEIPATHPRLAVWKTVGSCYRALWNRQVAQMPFIWVIVALGVIRAWTVYVAHQQDTSNLRNSPMHSHVAIETVGATAGLTEILALVSLHVSWVRYLVRGERPTGIYIGSAFWRYLIITTLMLLFSCTIIGTAIAFQAYPYMSKPGGVMENAPNSKLLQMGVTGLLVGLPFIWLFMQYYIKLASIAADDNSTTWKLSKLIMKENVLRVSTCYVTIFLVSSTLNQVTLRLFSHLGLISITADVTQSVISSGISIYQTVALATLMGITYRTLVGHHLHTAPSPSPAADTGA